MRTKTNISQRIRSLIDSGYNNKAIIEKLKCKPQAVYNIRYQINKERGLGSIGTLPKPKDGIGAPPKRAYTRKIKAGTGIALDPKPVINPAQNAYQYAPARAEGEPVFSVTMIEPPTLWERVKRWFRG